MVCDVQAAYYGIRLELCILTSKYISIYIRSLIQTHYERLPLLLTSIISIALVFNTNCIYDLAVKILYNIKNSPCYTLS